MTGRPTISVVIAAYNSRRRLMCAVETALNQTAAAEMEVVVVGDGVTDDSGEALRDLGDPRIVWENLDVNWGEQSVPSNRGIALARGDIVMFLNQDDLWLPGHVEACARLIRQGDVDVAFSRYLVVAPGATPGVAEPGNRIDGTPRVPPEFDPMTFVPASATAWRATALRSLGGWRRASEVTVSPSQDLLYRAKRAGLRMRMTPDPTVLVLWSGARHGCFEPGYEAADNIAWLDAISNQPCDVAASVDAALASAEARGGSERSTALVRVGGRLLQWGQERLGLHPATFGVARRYWRSGGFVNAARENAALDRRDFRSGEGGA